MTEIQNTKPFDIEKNNELKNFYINTDKIKIVWVIGF